MRRRLITSISRASGGTTARSAVELFVGEAARLLAWSSSTRGSMPSMKAQRQRDVVGDALGAHVVEERKAHGSAGSSSRNRTSSLAVVQRSRSGLLQIFRRVLDVEVAVPITTSAPGRQMKLRPKMSGCSVCTKTPTRHSGSPAATSRSQVSAIICAGLGRRPRAVDQPVADGSCSVDASQLTQAAVCRMSSPGDASRRAS